MRNNSTDRCKSWGCYIEKYDEQIDLLINNKDQLVETIKKIYSKTKKVEKEIIELYSLIKTIKNNLTLKNRFSINLSYASFLLSAVALALSLVACL